MDALKSQGWLPPATSLLWAARGALLLTVGLVAFELLADSFDLFLLSSALILSLLALSVDLQWGYAGILNLGPAAYLGLGAYTYALTLRRVHVGSPTYLAFVLAILLGVALALIVAWPAFRARTLQIYYALITLAVSLILQRWTSVSYDLTGGSNGIVGIPLPDFSLPGLDLKLTSPDQFFPLAAGTVIVAYLSLLWLTRSRFGRLLKGIRDDEEKVATLGYDVAGTKLIVAAIAGGLGALAGALYAPLAGTAHPSLFGVALSVQAFVWVAVGGQGTLLGPLLATLVLKLLENRLRGVSADGYVIILAVVFMLVVVFLPRGIAGLFAAESPLLRGWARRNAAPSFSPSTPSSGRREVSTTGPHDALPVLSDRPAEEPRG
jgi:ABC-type branched-subunit amino acid transport system permease subunit